MTDRLRIAIAAAVTSLFLAGVSVAGVMSHHSPQTTGAIQSSTKTAQQQPPATVGYAERQHTEHEQHD